MELSRSMSLSGSKSLGLSRSTSFLKLLVLGTSSVGKTSLLMRFTSNEFREETRATIGVDFRHKDLLIGDTTMAECQIWDTAGQERFSPVSKEYYRGAHGCAIVYDITDRDSFEGRKGIEFWLDELEKFMGIATKDKSQRKKFPIILIGNKSDLHHLRTIKTEEGIDIAKKYGLSFFETSAKTSDKVEDAFLELVTQIVNDINREKKKLDSRGSSEVDGDDSASFSSSRTEKIELEKSKVTTETKSNSWTCCS